MSAGQEFKNWKELCIFIDQPVLKANSRKAQKNRLSEYFTFHKVDGKQTIIIDSIIRQSGVSLSHGLFAHGIQSLLLNMLAVNYMATENNVMLITHNVLSERLSLTSKKFRKLMLDKKHVAIDYNVDAQIVSDFFYEITRQSKKRIISSMDGLVKSKLIEYNTIGMIAYAIGKDVKRRKMNSIEQKAYEEATEIVKAELNIKNQYVAAMHGMTKRYNDHLIQEISRILRLDNIRYCFQSYEIILSKDITCDDMAVNSLLLKETNSMENELLKNTHESTTERFKKMNGKSIYKISNEYGSIHPMDMDKHRVRSDDKFIAGTTLLINDILLDDSS